MLTNVYVNIKYQRYEDDHEIEHKNNRDISE